MNKFIAAEAAECIGCHACEIACAVAHNQENWPLSHSDFRPRIHVVGKGCESGGLPSLQQCPLRYGLSG